MFWLGRRSFLTSCKSRVVNFRQHYILTSLISPVFSSALGVLPALLLAEDAEGLLSVYSPSTARHPVVLVTECLLAAAL